MADPNPDSAPVDPCSGDVVSAPRKPFGRPFTPGQSGNPNGRPKGSRHKALLALDAIGSRAAAEVLRATVRAAKGGDTTAMRILLDRLWPTRKGRGVAFDLPPIAGAADIPTALAALLGAVAAGELSADEAAPVAVILDGARRAIETAELATRIAALEQGILP